MASSAKEIAIVETSNSGNLERKLIRVISGSISSKRQATFTLQYHEYIIAPRFRREKLWLFCNRPFESRNMQFDFFNQFKAVINMSQKFYSWKGVALVNLFTYNICSSSTSSAAIW